MKMPTVEPFFAEVNEEHVYSGKVLYRVGEKACTVDYIYDAMTKSLKLSQYGVDHTDLSPDASTVIQEYILNKIKHYE